MGGLLPGVMMGLMIAAVTYVICVKRNYRGKGHFSLKELGKSFVDAIWALLTPIIILGGIYSGFFTPTEAAAIGAFYAMLVGLFVYREMTLKSLVSAMTKAIRATAVIMLIVTTAQAFTWVMTRAMIPQKLSEVFINISSNPTVFMFVIAVLLLFLGCFLDGVAAIVILAPILAEAANGYGINPIHFGVVVITGLVLGLVTPPVGANLFVVSSVANRPIFKFVPELVPFFITAVIGYVLIILFPQLSTLIPTMLQK
jgi:C4-dicarboxylate transporter DctM subunit